MSSVIVADALWKIAPNCSMREYLIVLAALAALIRRALRRWKASRSTSPEPDSVR
jgi:hypothetical protein